MFCMREAKKGFGDEVLKRFWDRSLPRPVGETGGRSVRKRKKQPVVATMRVPRIGSPTYPEDSAGEDLGQIDEALFVDGHADTDLGVGGGHDVLSVAG